MGGWDNAVMPDYSTPPKCLVYILNPLYKTCTTQTNVKPILSLVLYVKPILSIGLYVKPIPVLSKGFTYVWVVQALTKGCNMKSNGIVLWSY